MFLFNCRSHHTAACERTAKVRESRIGRREKLDFFSVVAKIPLIVNEISISTPTPFGGAGRDFECRSISWPSINLYAWAVMG
jgi:hypothetical protein